MATIDVNVFVTGTYGLDNAPPTSKEPPGIIYIYIYICDLILENPTYRAKCRLKLFIILCW